MKAAGTLAACVLFGASLAVAAGGPPGVTATGARASDVRVTSGGASLATSPLRLRGNTGSDASTLWAGAVALLAVVGGGWVAWRRSGKALRLPGRTRKGRPLTRLSSQALTPHASVHAVRWNGEELLVGCTAQHITLLSRRPGERAGGATE